jgi:hypothetical protein
MPKLTLTQAERLIRRDHPSYAPLQRRAAVDQLNADRAAKADKAKLGTGANAFIKRALSGAAARRR